MPTIAEDQIKAVENWFNMHTRREYSRDGSKIIDEGYFGQILPVGIASSPPDVAAHISNNHLVFMSPQAGTVTRTVIPVGSNRAINRNIISRIKDLLSQIDGLLPDVAVVGLPTAATTIQTALNDAGLGSIDLDTRGVLALPLYAFPNDQMYDTVQSVRGYLASLLPVT